LEIDENIEMLTHDNLEGARTIDRTDIREDFVDTADTIMKLTDYGVEHHCIGHTFVVRMGQNYVGMILIGDAIPWESDPPQMQIEPFYRLMGFVIDRHFRRKGIGGRVLEKAIETVYAEYGTRPIALGCHKENEAAARFYVQHGFRRVDYMEGNDYYYLRYPANGNTFRNTV